MSTNPLAASGDAIQHGYTVSIPLEALNINTVKKALVMGRPISFYNLLVLLRGS